MKPARFLCFFVANPVYLIVITAISDIEKAQAGRNAARKLALFGLLAAPWLGFLAIALRPNPRQMWAQSWPTITFVGLYQIALDRFVHIEGLEHLPATGPVILAGNHINKTAMDAMLLGSTLLTQGRGLAKFVSQADPPERILKHFIRLMGNAKGVILPITSGMTTGTMIRFLKNPSEFKRSQPILGIFPAGSADRDFEAHMQREWHTGTAVAAFETGAQIVPFHVQGLPYHWGPLDLLKSVARSLTGGEAFDFRVRLGPPLRAGELEPQGDYAGLMERVRQAILQLSV
jgi:1-acyl-sn-glycerol-3-phosphate acyltransferase